MGFDRVRVRIAPSPTGDPHVGTAYIALFNYIFAKKHGGQFVLRIEDTDQVRAKASSEQMIMDSLKWLGLQWNEGPDVGGLHGPYRQSERREIYQKHIEILLEKGCAYRCFCTPERLDQVRQQKKDEGHGAGGYDRFCRSLSKDEIKRKLDAKTPFVVRLKMPTEGVTVVNDLLRGKVEFENQRVDDQVLIKSDGLPTYHMANVVDDHLMGISHVIRAEEWISSTPKHVVLYKSFGWDEPTWVHMPLLRNTDKSKISKRKCPVSINYYRRIGILKDAMLNFLALMGWSYGNDVEMFSLQQMMEKFELKNIQLGGPVFDLVKLTWLNQQYLQKLSDDEIVEHLQNEVFSREYLKQLAPLIKKRIARFDQFVDQNAFFFNGPLNYDHVPVIPEGKTKDDMKTMINGLLEQLDDLYVWDIEHIKELLHKYKDTIKWKPRDVFMPLRLITTGKADSPPLEDTLMVLGREIVRFRLRDYLSKIDMTEGKK